MNLPKTGIAGYVRLSRAELHEQGTFEEKVERHKRILLRLAEVHHIPLTAEQIVVEIKSGEKLSTRPGLLGILEQARSGQLRVLVAMAVDRLTRSIVDQAPIADSFFAGEVLLVTQDGKTLFDQKLDITPWQMKALIAEWERDRYSFRRKIHNEERASQGERSSGYAPYGYVWVKRRLSEDGRSIVERGHYAVIEVEYAIIEELFRRIWHEGISSIQRDFNRRFKATGHPAPPSHGRRDGDQATFWSSSTMHKILSNPHYAGFPAHRTAMQRGKGRTKLPKSDWVLATTEQDYPHPLDGLEAWYELQAHLTARRSNFGGNTTQGVLTRLLKCPRGRPMHRGGQDQYMCTCSAEGDPHPSSYILAARVEAIAVLVLQEAFAALPLSALPSMATGTDRKTLSKQRTLALQEQAAQEHLATELMKNATLIISLYGEADFREKAEVNKRALDAARTRVAELDALLAQPDLASKQDLLERIAALGRGDIRLGTERLWTAASIAKRREILRYVIAEIRLLEPPASHKRTRQLVVTVQPFYAAYYTPPVFDFAELFPHHQTQKMRRGEGRNRHICAQCGKVVFREPSHDTWKLVFCNKECYAAYRAKQAQGRTQATYHCDQCGKPFERTQAQANRKKLHFCGRACFKAYKAGNPINFNNKDES